MATKLAEAFGAKKSSAVSSATKMLLDPNIELLDKRMLLGQLAHDDSQAATKAIEELLSLASKELGDQSIVKKQKQLDAMIAMLKEGPLRLGTYIGKAEDGLANRVQILLENGDSAFPAMLDPAMASSLKCGDAVLLDAQARAVLACGPSDGTGEVAELKQRLSDDYVKVALNDLNSEAYRVSDLLRRQLDAGEVEPGAELLVCTRRRFAFAALPKAEGLSNYMFLEEGPVQQVDVERDIGNPHPFIEELTEHVRDEMTNPALGRKYGIRPMQTRLLRGPTGTGKTYSVLGLIYNIYRVMSEVTGAPIEALPNRVLRMRPPKVLNKYVGESDKRLDRFYDEVKQLANEPFIWNGKKWLLPVVARCEEIDSLARARNGSDDVMGRIQTTSLERLDHLSNEMGKTLCIFLFTTNLSELCDQAFIRRAGGEVIDFGRIGRGQFQTILAKKIRGLPIHPALGAEPSTAEHRLARDVTNWMFSRNGHDAGQIEVTLAGSATRIVKHRRDMLTGSVVDLSVQQASKTAKQLEKQGGQTPGLTTELLLAAFDKQIQGICQHITEFNVHTYLTLPEGSRVASVRRIEQPAIHSFDMERAS